MFRALMCLALLVIVKASDSNCPNPKICLVIFCVAADRECAGGTIIPNAGYCGCCPACVPNLTIALLALIEASDCPDPSICLRIFCGVADRLCLGGTVIPNAGFCGCCPACVPNLISGACPPDICWRMFCPVLTSCPNGQLISKAGYCGCCAACVPDLKIGDPCGHTFLTGSVQGRCPKGSICDHTTVTCKPSKVSTLKRDV